MQLSKRKTAGLITLFCITYMVSYMTRINYGAIIAEMEQATQISKQLLSMALTGSFFTYGAGQIISGIAGDKFSPKRLVLYGLALTVLMNLLIPICQNPWQMTVAWSINGFAQAFMWPPMLKLMVVLLKFPINANAFPFTNGKAFYICIHGISPCFSAAPNSVPLLPQTPPLRSFLQIRFLPRREIHQTTQEPE